MVKPPDLAFEALAEVTGTDWNAGRGELNSALASIREQWQGEPDDVAQEIIERAKLYRRAMPEVMLTPTALSKHWKRVHEKAYARREQGTNLSRNVSCVTCGGHRFVVVSTRKFPQTAWAREHGITPNAGLIEEYAACPSCSATCDTSFRRFDGTTARALDPDRVRELMVR